jgi:hypothetical protein
MADPKQMPKPAPGWRDSFDGDVLEIKEEDTVPAKRPESYRKWLEQKYGRKAPPANPAPEQEQ